jgi:hypothetical protein
VLVYDEDMTDQDWAAWFSLVKEIATLVDEQGLSSQVAFHGTSNNSQFFILKQGLKPTAIAHAHFGPPETLAGTRGSFWGCIKTAAWYAESDVIERHQFGRPVLFAVPCQNLHDRYGLYPDKASFYAPVVPARLEALRNQRDRWELCHRELGWAAGMDEIGAVFAVHEEHIPPQEIAIIESVAAFQTFVSERMPFGRQPGV